MMHPKIVASVIRYIKTDLADATPARQQELLRIIARWEAKLPPAADKPAEKEVSHTLDWAEPYTEPDPYNPKRRV